MSGYSRFGDYVLLRKIGETSFGESYRAGRVGESGAVGDVVQLWLFGGADDRATQLARQLRLEAATANGPGWPVRQAAGSESGLCYVAYAYRAGRDLATLLQRANDGFSSLAMEHALLIVERLAKGLAWLHGEVGVAHGFVVPELVRVTEEGETLLLGFELGSSLASEAANGRLDGSLAAYLSPEVQTGTAPSARDDVFALGAILLELLTGAPPRREEGLAARLQRARLIETEQPIPPILQQLIAESLAPPADRLAHAKAWHERLSAAMGEIGIRATNFDLAFFFQELFRDDLKKEVREQDEEQRSLTAPAVAVEASAPAAVPVTEPDAAVSAPSEPSVDATVVDDDFLEEATGGRGKMLAIVAVLAAVVAGAAFFALRGSGRQAGAPPPPVEVAAVTPPTTPARTGPAMPSDGIEDATVGRVGVEGAAADAATGGDTEEGSARAMSLDAASADLEKMIQDRAADLEARLASEYDQEIAAMRAQLEAARQVEADARAALQAQAGDGEASPPSAPANPPATVTPPAVAAPTEGAAVPGEGLPATEATVASAEPPGDANQDAAGSAPATGGDTPPPTEATPEPVAATQVATTTPPPSTPPPTAPPPPATPPQAAAAAAPKVVPPRLVEPPVPRYPAAARNAKRSATVIVKVLVGRDGRVVKADRVSDKMVGYGFDQAAINAARTAVYQPATVDGRPVEQWTTLVLRFEP